MSFWQFHIKVWYLHAHNDVLAHFNPLGDAIITPPGLPKSDECRYRRLSRWFWVYSPS
jgi:hypothetical protein